MAIVHHRNPRSERHRFNLIVRDINNRLAKLLMKFLDLSAHFDAKFRVEIGERLVKQEHIRMAHKGPPHRHPLPLAARKLAGLAFKERIDMQEFGHLLEGALLFATGTLRVSMPKVMFLCTVFVG